VREKLYIYGGRKPLGKKERIYHKDLKGKTHFVYLRNNEQASGAQSWCME
jgi:hypothetical protein